ncbi:hypothetical protein K432DRAFT_394939 [Lepidopterella palustris CBS 459.81]|uniref:Uncharacterized protein n=1 Tax=Lepidopterella palustris CBS 459.81 TaxID=1314670 RepID=A0A8E2E6D6_9PEZI|nr:hypothetical protein K432DRAFT_394939 [Lepidopterella palustris CBS 459.81]
MVRYRGASASSIDSASKISLMVDSLLHPPALYQDIPPDHPLRFSHLLTPIPRYDFPSYSDFGDLLKTSRPTLSQFSKMLAPMIGSIISQAMPPGVTAKHALEVEAIDWHMYF